jgi:hypothetical protein
MKMVKVFFIFVCLTTILAITFNPPIIKVRKLLTQKICSNEYFIKSTSLQNYNSFEVLINDSKCSINKFNTAKDKATVICPDHNKSLLNQAKLEVTGYKENIQTQLFKDLFNVEIERPELNLYNHTMIRLSFKEDISCLKDSDIVFEGVDYSVKLDSNADIHFTEDFESNYIEIRIMGFKLDFNVRPLFTRVILK